MSILVCIPAFNEGKVIDKVIKDCLKFSNEVVVCDDGSMDNTYEVADSAGADVIRHEKNIGKGESLRSLFKFARHSNHDIIVTIDGDGQFIPEEIPKLVKSIKENKSDLVIGYRFDDTTEIPNYRRFGNKMLDKMTNMVEEISVRDTQSGFRAYSRKVIDDIDFKMKGFGADAEILIDAAKKGYRLSEEKITVIYDTGTKTSTKNPISHTEDWKLRSTLENHAPLKFMGIPGIILMIAGLCFTINVAVTFSEIGYFSIPFTLIGATCLALGLILFLMSILLFSISKRSLKK